jgi:hypothetical protein
MEILVLQGAVEFSDIDNMILDIIGQDTTNVKESLLADKKLYKSM